MILRVSILDAISDTLANECQNTKHCLLKYTLLNTSTPDKQYEHPVQGVRVTRTSSPSTPDSQYQIFG